MGMAGASLASDEDEEAGEEVDSAVRPLTQTTTLLSPTTCWSERLHSTSRWKSPSTRSKLARPCRKASCAAVNARLLNGLFWIVSLVRCWRENTAAGISVKWLSLRYLSTKIISQCKPKARPLVKPLQISQSGKAAFEGRNVVVTEIPEKTTRHKVVSLKVKVRLLREKGRAYTTRSRSQSTDECTAAMKLSLRYLRKKKTSCQ
jgi:hypothetical protein